MAGDSLESESDCRNRLKGHVRVILMFLVLPTSVLLDT